MITTTGSALGAPVCRLAPQIGGCTRATSVESSAGVGVQREGGSLARRRSGWIDIPDPHTSACSQGRV